MATPLTLKQRFERKLPRVLKAGRHWLRAVADRRRPETRLVFVVGSQRSGTRVPIEAMDLAPQIATFTEGSSPYFRGVLLEPLDQVEQLVARSPAPVVALKPICETHRVIELLDRFPGSRAVWIFRHYRDAVNSSSTKWRSGREAVRRLAAGETRAAGWRAGGLSQAKLELVTRLYREDMSLHEANAVMWYLRNGLFFDLGASARPDVLLVRYEDLVAHPRERFAELFRFIGLPVPEGIDAAVRRPEGGDRTFPEISPEIRDICDRLHERLLSHYASRAAAADSAVASGRR